MAMAADDMLAHPAPAAQARNQAQALIHQTSARTTSPFATRRRWLTASAASDALALKGIGNATVQPLSAHHSGVRTKKNQPPLSSFC